jgi:hypothetical protein
VTVDVAALGDFLRTVLTEDQREALADMLDGGCDCAERWKWSGPDYAEQWADPEGYPFARAYGSKVHERDCSIIRELRESYADTDDGPTPLTRAEAIEYLAESRDHARCRVCSPELPDPWPPRPTTVSGVWLIVPPRVYFEQDGELVRQVAVAHEFMTCAGEDPRTSPWFSVCRQRPTSNRHAFSPGEDWDPSFDRKCGHCLLREREILARAARSP